MLICVPLEAGKGTLLSRKVSKGGRCNKEGSRYPNRFIVSLCGFTIVQSESNRVRCVGLKYRLKTSYKCPLYRDSTEIPIMLSPYIQGCRLKAEESVIPGIRSVCRRGQKRSSTERNRTKSASNRYWIVLTCRVTRPWSSPG